MIKYCLEKWEQNKLKLKQALKEKKRSALCDMEYLDLAKMLVEHVYCPDYDPKQITEINNGDYQGTLLYVFPRETYQPDSEDYLMTKIEYGSCSVCDILQRAKENEDKRVIVDDFMRIALRMVQETVKPYKGGWKMDEEQFSEVTWSNPK